MAFPHFINFACFKLSRDFVAGVSVAEREELLEDVVHIAWAMSDGPRWSRSWS